MSGKFYKVFGVTSIVLVILLIPFSLHPNINNNLTLNAVLVKVLGGNPGLAAMRYEVKSKDGEIYQQSRLTNPEFEFELENFAGSGELSGFGRSEYTALLSQEIPTGNKRSLSVRIAKVEKTISELMINKKGADLLLEAKKKFYELYFLQEKIALKRKQISQIENFKLQILKRVRAGKTSPLELSRIKIYLLRCKTNLKSAVSEFYSTGVYLASLWGEDSFSYKSVIAEYSEWEQFTINEEMNKISDLNPDLAMLKKEIQHHEAELRLEKAIKIPNISISGGIKHHSEIGLTAFTAGISIPVPLFDNNKGGVSTAGYLVDKAVAELKAEVLRIRSELTAKCRTLKTELGNTKIYKNEIIPESEKTLKIISEAYAMGRSDYVEVIDVYDSVYEINEEYIQSIRDRRIELAEIERLNGRILSITINRSENEK